MATADDVAAAILELTGPLDTFKLQKLVYYSQAWHLVWEEEPLFEEPIEAWVGGPVVPDLYARHRGSFRVDRWQWGDSQRLTDEQRESVSAVVASYGRLSGRQLSRLTHNEAPWRDARGALGPGERGHSVIAPGAMQDYYSGIDQSEEATLVSDLPSVDEESF